MKKSILVTGGCGYIGSHLCRQLATLGHQVIVIDNLSTGFRDALTGSEIFYELDIGSPSVEEVFRNFTIDCIVHLAASIVVPESMENPLAYYVNNTKKTIQLLELVARYQVPSIVFSSTAAVYDAADHPLSEDDATNPLSPYGSSKLMDERILLDVASKSAMNVGILRYFNVAGADPLLRSGQRSPDATHLIKVACEVLCGKRPTLTVFGDDYQTPDGTCVRDYIHVEDLADAHIATIEHLTKSKESTILNCGYRQGFSVLEVIKALETVSGKTVPRQVGPRRSGDLSYLVADNRKILAKLEWQPRFNNLEEIVSSAYEWEKKLP